jgi:hypothetical protein
MNQAPQINNNSVSQHKAIITAASGKYFPSLINLLGSIKQNYPDHPKIFVYDLGMPAIFVSELKSLKDVEVIAMPIFCKFWRSCYTWKTYIFSHPLADLNFYLDAGCQVLRPLDRIFDTLEKEDFFAIGQGVLLEKIVPKEYKAIFEISNEFDDCEVIHAGEFGFKNKGKISNILNQTFDCALSGLALGFSPKDIWRNKGYNKSQFVRNCEIFRHDLTLLNILIRKHFGRNVKIHSVEQFAGGRNAHQEQFIWHLRMDFKNLSYVNLRFLHTDFSCVILLNRLVISLMILIKNIKTFFRKFKIGL